MRVVAVNGSPRAKGNTFCALNTVAEVLEKEGIETEIVQIGNRNIRGCIACGKCAETGCCVFEDEFYKKTAEKMYNADGILLGSPVYYAAIAGTMKCFLDKVFYASQGRFRHKIGAGIASLRRSGGIAAFNQLNNYFLISEMVIAPSFYWNIAHGAAEGEMLKDTEAVSVLKNLGQNMAWLIKMKEFSKETIAEPAAVKKQKLNMIR